MAKLTFQKATRQKSKLRLALVGPSGSGKTYSALAIATELVGPSGRVAVIDTEHGSASKYAGRFSFDVLELDSCAPSTYVEALQAAAEAGYDAVVVDSLSHAWMGRDGALEQVDKAAKRSQSGNTFTAWRDVTPQHNALVEALITAPLHVVATMRAKTEYVMEKDRNGKTSPRKVGLAPVQRDGLEYEFDVLGDIDLEHNLIISKTRCESLSGAVIQKPGANVAKVLLAWLSDGADAPKVAPRFSAPAAAPTQQHGSDELDEALVEKYVEKIALAVECDTAQKMIALGNELGEARASGALRGATLRAVADAFSKGRDDHKARLQGRGRSNGAEVQS